MTKAEEVLDTVELLEMILLEVDDEYAVLLSQRVNKTFRGTVQGSTKLKKKLWLEPDDYDAENDYSRHRKEPNYGGWVGVELNPCIVRAYNMDFALSVADYARSDVMLELKIHPDAMARKEQSWQKMEIIRFAEPYAKFCITVLIPRFARTYYKNFKQGTTFKDVIEYVKVQADDWTWN